MNDSSKDVPANSTSSDFATGLLAALCVALAVVAVAAFWPAHSASWVNWDDDLNLTNNQEWRGLTGENLRWMFTTGHAGVYQPLGWAAFAVQHAIFDQADGRLSFGAYHAVSLGVHALNAVLFFLICVKLFGMKSSSASELIEPAPRPATMAFAAVAALLFAVHPLRTECVAWLSCQPYLFAATFALLAVWVYLFRWQHMRGRGIPSLLLVTLLFGISQLFKAYAIALPVVLLLLDVYPLRRIQRRDGRIQWGCPLLLVAEKLPMIAIAGFIAWRGHIATAAFFPSAQPTWMQRSLTAICATVHYLQTTVWPMALSPRYEQHGDLAWRDASVIRSLVVIGMLTVVALGLAIKRRPALLVAWLAYLALIGPMLGFVWHGEQFAADRYTYLACMPWVVLIGAMLVAISRVRPRLSALTPAPFVMASIVLFALSWRQSKVWADSVRLWRHALALDAQSGTAQLNLGLALASRDVNPSPNGPTLAELTEARGLFEKIIETQPASFNAWKGLGIAFSGLDMPEEAVRAQETALRIRPNDPAAVYSYATALSEAGRYQDAKSVFERAIELDPRDYRALTNLGITLSRINRLTEAVTRFKEAIDINPAHARAWFALGNVHVRLNQLNDARAAYEQALRYEPDSVEVRVAQAGLLDRGGKRDEAVKMLAQTADAFPAAPESFVTLGRMLQQDRRWREARRVLTRGYKNLQTAGRVDPALNAELAWLLSTCPEEDMRDGYNALKLAAQAYSVDHGRSYRTLEVLAAASAANGQFDQAVEVVNRAIEAASDSGVASIKQVLETHRQFYLRKQPLRAAAATSQPAMGPAPLPMRNANTAPVAPVSTAPAMSASDASTHPGG